MSSRKRPIYLATALLLFVFTATNFITAKSPATAAQKKQTAKIAKEEPSAYLFVYFTGNKIDEEQIRFALSKDGYNFRALNQNKPVISSAKISTSGGVRDPHILRGADGKTFYLVATDMVSAKGWDSNRAMVLLKSTDLIHWKSSVVNIPTTYEAFKNANRVWAPQTIFDPSVQKYMVYWAMRSGKEADKIYYSYANKDFTALESEPKQLLYSPGNFACIDADIIFDKGKYNLFFKTEGNGNGIKKAISDKLTEGYVIEDRYLQQTKDAVEGAGVFKLNNSDSWILMYDVYMKGRYQFTKSSDLENFKVIDENVTMNFHPRHGTVLPITQTEADRLSNYWLSADEVLQSAKSPSIKQRNIAIDTLANKLLLPLKESANLTAFNPQFASFPGATVTPKGAVDFSKGAVKYTVTIKGKKPVTYEVEARKFHNPVLDGFYADPEVIYSEKTGKYYIYPTSDGFNGWSGTYFKTFSSPDLVNWTDEGIIIDLNKDVTWAKRNAWAPCIVEKKINGAYKYFYYFTAAQKIGVAVADNPTGPFTDSGKALIDKYPDGITRGQQIDPDVFTDPKTNKSYLYWGNGYMAAAELNDDMTSVKTETTKIITPNNTFREGSYVFYRNGKYYFMWSDDDTRSENYCVRYGTSDSPLGPISVPEKNLVIIKDKPAGIFGTGHNSVLQLPGKDEWYIVYHRFNFPNGIKMGDAAGYNREVCIDRMTFDEDGSIKQVTPTHKGIDAVSKK